jgi:hypothetical protein
MWIRASGAFTPIVEPTLFDAVQQIVHERNRRFSSDEMIERLSALLKRTGWLSGLVIDEHDDMPSSSAYRSRFGSLLRAYRLVGYSPARDYEYVEINRVLRTVHADVVAQTMAEIERLGGTVRRNPTTDLLTVNDEFTASIVISRATQTVSGGLRWKIRLDTSLRPAITVAVRMDQANRQAFDYFLLPSIDVSMPRLRLREENGFLLDAYRFDSLDSFFYLAARTQLRMAS